MISLLLSLSLLIWVSHGQETTSASIICPDPNYTLADNTSLCYSYKQTRLGFFAANRSCSREGAILLSIESPSEDAFIWRSIFSDNDTGGVEFWIGLNDIDEEGIFRWSNSSLRDPLPSYFNWSGGSVESTNAASLDCVKFTGNGWAVHSGACATSSLFYVCKMFSCRSNDGVYCIGSEPTLAPSTGVPVSVVIIIIVVLLAMVGLVAVIVLLVLLWKYNNDAFNRFCCCCLSRGATSNVHSLQQENQRLRHELSQHKLTTSGRYSQGQFARELSGVPDGRGGVLPTIKAPLTTPSIPEKTPLTFNGTSPPPLIPQRVSTTRVTPIRHPSVTTPTGGAPIGAFTSSGFRRQISAPVLLGNQPMRSRPSLQFPTKTILEEEKRESDESSSEDSTSEHSAHSKTDKGTTE